MAGASCPCRGPCERRNRADLRSVLPVPPSSPTRLPSLRTWVQCGSAFSRLWAPGFCLAALRFRSRIMAISRLTALSELVPSTSYPSGPTQNDSAGYCPPHFTGDELEADVTRPGWDEPVNPARSGFRAHSSLRLLQAKLRSNPSRLLHLCPLSSLLFHLGPDSSCHLLRAWLFSGHLPPHLVTGPALVF